MNTLIKVSRPIIKLKTRERGERELKRAERNIAANPKTS
jgi:hypothetical protein